MQRPGERLNGQQLQLLAPQLPEPWQLLTQPVLQLPVGHAQPCWLRPVALCGLLPMPYNAPHP